MSTAAERAKRDREIARDIRAGIMPVVLARKYQLTMTRVRQIAEREGEKRKRVNQRNRSKKSK